jgi:hypothetical protein
MVMAVHQFERLFREAVTPAIDLDKSDIKRLEDFIGKEVHALLMRAQAFAKANGRDVISVIDLPITKGLQESIHQFKKLDIAVELKNVLDQIAGLPELDLGYDESVEEKLPEIAGGVAVSIARVLRACDGSMKNPSTEDWDRAEKIFEILA